MAGSNSYTVHQPVKRRESPEAMDNGEEVDTTLKELPFYNEDSFTDVILVVEGQQLFTSRSLLAYASPVFSCMFTAEFREKDEKVGNVQRPRLSQMGLDARKPVFGGLRTSKAQTSLRIRAV